ncbi:hypothetical protein FLAG1_08136 [Fusarium langsethiae]|uniref:DUF6546 domain-containing protein n=1 Tax=Fusarium langsethiae TaxID=179993 RepID=A0A0M9ESQ4_FUSLA|nr:hypothetical protein FLAG1_08136 [Fusarium langsethiae]GKU05289.1 unnamed protein product [Fusarium langsethiae]GKU17637.1 unnamed protein product [Fusarium langsethiae]
MILHLVAEPSTTSSTPHTTSSLPSKPHLAPYACVDKFWNSFFESRTFNSLTITQDDIPALSHIHEKPKVLWKLDSAFIKTGSSLWDVLSEWDSTGQEGMTLELSAFSPSDWVGFLLDDCSVEKDVELYKKYLASGSTEQFEAAGDVHKPYINLYGAFGIRSRYLPNEKRDQYWFATVKNLLGWEPLEFSDDAAELPPVSVVTKFLIRRQQFREIYPTTLNKMLGSLFAVQDIHIERWCCAESRDEKSWCKEAHITFGMDLPPSVKRLSLYGETSKVFHTWAAKETTVVSLAKTLRQYTRDLESLPDGKNLKRLSLTSDIFKTGTKKDINNLLCAAARAAKKMPSLEMLELWNGDTERACVFCYRVEDTVGEITWRGTHLPALNNEVLRAWVVASINNNRPDVRESSEPIKAEDVASARQVLKYLASKDQVMHSVSVCRAIGKRKRNDSDEG